MNGYIVGGKVPKSLRRAIVRAETEGLTEPDKAKKRVASYYSWIAPQLQVWTSLGRRHN